MFPLYIEHKNMFVYTQNFLPTNKVFLVDCSVSLTSMKLLYKNRNDFQPAILENGFLDTHIVQ